MPSCPAQAAPEELLPFENTDLETARATKNSTNAGKSTGSDALVSDAALAKWKRPAYSGSSLNNAVLVELRALEQSRQYGDGKHKVLHLQKVADRFDEVAELRERFRPLIVEECVQIVAGELRPLARRHNATTYMLQLLESPPPKSSKAVSVRFKVLTPISTIAHRTMHESTPYLVRAKRANANWLVGMVAKKSHTMSDGILVLDMLLPVELGFDAVLSAGTEYEARPGPGLVMFERMYSVKVKKLPFMRKILGMKEPKHVLFSDSDSETNAAADGPKSANEKTKDVTKAVSGAQGNQALVTAFENSPFRASLNVSQKDAITSVLREDHVSSAQKIFMWQGPPGSGKSSTLSRLLGFLCSQFDQSSSTKGTGPTSSAHRIMVCGPSNQSVHVLVDKLRETCSTYGIRCPEIALSAVNDSVPARLQELFVHGVFMEWARRFRKLVGQLSIASAEAELKILLDSIWTRVPHATKAFRVTRDYLGVLTRTYALAVRRQERAAARDKTREEQASDDDTSEVVVVKPSQVKDDGKSTSSQSEAPQSAAPKVSPSGDSAAGSTPEKATFGSEKETLTRRWQVVDPGDEEASDYDGVVEIVEERRGRAVSSGPPAKVENKFDSRILFHLLEENRTKVLQSIFGALRLLVIQPGPLRKFPRAKVVYVRSGFIVDDDGEVVMDRNRSCVGKHGSDFFLSEDEIIQHIPRDAEWIITMRSSLDFLQTCPAVANYLARFTSRSLATLMEELSQADSAPESSTSSQSHRAGGISDAVQHPSASSSKGAVFVVRDRSSSILSQTSKLSEQIIMDSDDSEDEAESTEAAASNATTSFQQTSGARKALVAKSQPLSPVMESRVTSKRAQSGESSTADGEEEEVSSSKSSSDSDSDSDLDSSSSSSSSSSDSSSSDSSDDSSDESDNSAARTKRRKRSGEQGAFLEPIRQSFEAFAAALEELSNSRAAEQEFLQTAEVLFCTLAVSGRKSVRAANEAAGLSFLIIDEAAQAVEAETWVALQSVPDRMLLVGDPKQLSATVTSSVAQDLGFGRSLMERLMWGLSLPYHLLKVQYRMHPDISRFPVRFFYNNELEDGSNVRGPSPDWFAARGLMDPWYGPYAFLDVPNGREERQGRGSSYYNDAEAEIVARLAQNLVQRGVDVAKELIVITFYSGQVRTIATALSRHHIRNVVVSTVDSFQGSEASVVILSFVRANREGRVGFLSDLRRLNVALTRAKHSLILVGCGETLSRADDSCMRDLIKDARDRSVYKQLDNAQQPRDYRGKNAHSDRR
ncbi:Regulator of nonsense transcripts 1-like [Hondaea fermentalgiana]|uniref:Regulator of nonsense transcripts 1-like n=1 Tax=Hondaea fermentalgiana TaxID=2315210 RepID=A0A2R5GNS5_9STRA|nr:Regulator of nonsense transcripts 1-like [Hondaea fermentalgiana]|eukprot:GBG32530.1 Regulator of nonsense transcripts 1-like [Hondaea fermentalgiana]